MIRNKYTPMIQALLAAVLFGAGTPIIKLFLRNADPLPVAGLLYLGSGAGLLIFILIRKALPFTVKTQSPVSRKDFIWLGAATLCGGVIGPILWIYGLRATPTSTAALLVNFEGISTVLIAAVIFKEAIGKRIWTALAFITPASLILSWNANGGWGFSMGAFAIVLATVFWGADNNFTRHISAKDPYIIVAIKGLAAGAVTLFCAVITRSVFPSVEASFLILLLGFISYGMGLVFFVLSLRNLGASRATAFLGIAPFVGVLLSFVLLRESTGVNFVIALPLMIVGAILIFGENHSHVHKHEMLEHEHSHRHNDGHHDHMHTDGQIPVNPAAAHSHPHRHEESEHSHRHTPDIHHRHSH